ncbi:copper resistance CopC/CopD family protein [Castellaniella hirudinis]|uniref:Copper resistance CopC/CopD family protein n=1 Tax=Castellaniella hirudinis TaxID=1144617 RepID=A0ABV8RVL7_9BURK
MSTHRVRRIGAPASLAGLSLALLRWLCALAMLAWAPGALAHASLIASLPATGTVLPQAPAAMRLTFNEPVSPLLIRFIQPDGSTKDITQTEVLPTGLEMALPTLDQQGTYALSWHVVSADGHPVGGTVTFSIGVEGTRRVQESSRHPARVFLIWLSRLGGYIGLFAGIGMALCHAFCAARTDKRRLAFGFLALGAVATLLNVGLLGLDALDEPASALFSPGPWRTAFSTSFGLAATLALAALGAAALAWLQAAPIPRRLVVAAALLLLGTSLAASGHASSAPPAWLARPAVWLHVLAITLWIGSLLPLAHSLQDMWQTNLLKRFSKLIPAVLLILFASGGALVYLQFDKPSSLWQTGYGQILALKLALLIVLLVLGTYNRLRLTDAVLGGQLPARRVMRRVIYAECAVALLILATVALWRFTPPPRALHSLPPAPAELTAHIHDTAAMADLALTLPAPDQSGHLTLYLSNADLTPLAAQEVDVAFSNPQAGIEPIVLPASRANDGTWQVGDLELPGVPAWHIRIDALISDFDSIRLETTLETGQSWRTNDPN